MCNAPGCTHGHTHAPADGRMGGMGEGAVPVEALRPGAGPIRTAKEGDEIFAALDAAARERILILDGAMGTMIQKQKLAEDNFRGTRFADWPKPLQGNNDILVLTEPKLIEDIHFDYAMAGADIFETNTFSGTTIAQADYGMQALAYEINVAGAQVAKRAAERAEAKDGKRRFVAGAVGPTNRTASISPDVNNPGYRATSFDELRIAYGEQIEGLIDGGSDLILIETIFDTLNAKAAIFAAEEVFAQKGIRLPIMISGTITDLSGRTLSGQTPTAFWHSLRHAKPFTFGLNCALGANAMRAHLAEIAEIADTFVCAYPNAGLPNAFGEYDESPEFMASQIEGFARDGLLNIVGGCCGSTPEHIAAIAGAVANHKPRELPTPAPLLRLSGLEPFTLTSDIPFVNVGERTNVTGSARFKKLIKGGDYATALDVARDQVENGAQVIDINMDEGLIDSQQVMVEYLNLVASEPDIARVPIMVDEGGRGQVPRAGAPVQALWRRRGRHGVRRSRAGRYQGAQGRNLHPRLPYPGGRGRLPARRHHLRSQHFCCRHRHRRARQLRRRFHRGHPRNHRHAPPCPRFGRSFEPFLLVPRQRAGARGDARGFPLPRHQGGDGHGHRQCRPARRL